MKKIRSIGRALSGNEMKKIAGGINPPANGYCYQLAENCYITGQPYPCCPGLSCLRDYPQYPTGHCIEIIEL
ncbi:MAG: hypothetical protein QM687_10800 [Ferruginibacter sp.]